MSFDPRCIYEGTSLPSAAALLVTGEGGTQTTLTKVTVVNYSAASQTFTFWVLPSGVGATADRYLIVENKAIPAGQTVDVAEMRAQTLNAGDSIWGVASNATTLAARINANVVT